MTSLPLARLSSADTKKISTVLLRLPWHCNTSRFAFSSKKFYDLWDARDRLGSLFFTYILRRPPLLILPPWFLCRKFDSECLARETDKQARRIGENYSNESAGSQMRPRAQIIKNLILIISPGGDRRCATSGQPAILHSDFSGCLPVRRDHRKATLLLSFRAEKIFYLSSYLAIEWLRSMC